MTIPSTIYRQNVRYKFDAPTSVAGVEIVQHVNGITEVEGLSGNSFDAMTSLGAVFGPSGDVTSGFVSSEAASQPFIFNSPGPSATIFQVIVRKTVYVSAFACYRIFPLDAAGHRIPIAAATLPPGSQGLAVVEVSIPPNSQSPYSRPFMDNVWGVAAPPFPLDFNLGIGIIIHPEVIAANVPSDFALHLDSLSPSPSYIDSNVPNPVFATVTYKFNKATAVSGVEIAQHVFGVTKVEGLLGNDLNSLTSIGSVFGPSGDIVGGFVVPSDGVSQVFQFSNTTATGTTFQLVIRKTPYFNAFAFHRAYPLDLQGNRIPAAEAPLDTPPTVTCPTAAVLEAQSAAGTPAILTGLVSDTDGDALTAMWSINGQLVETNSLPALAAASPAPVTLTNIFPLGTNIVLLSVSDGQNPAVSCSTSVTVRDTTPPETFILQVTVLGAILTNGARTIATDLNIHIGATDAVGVAGFVFSLDGGPFTAGSDPILLTGLTRTAHSIAVTAFDTSGNIDPTPAVFSWTVLTPQQAAANLIGQVGTLVTAGALNQAQANSLTVKLQATISQMNVGNPVAAVNQLNAFINQVNARVLSGRLNQAVASTLITAAHQIQGAIP